MLFLCGVVLGIGYDFFKSIRKKLSYDTKISVLCDLLFGIFSVGAVTMVMYFRYSLELRFYRFCGIVCGFSFYFLVLSPLFLKFFNKFINFFEKIFKILFTITKFCAKILKKCFCIVLYPFLRFKKCFWKFIFKIRFKLLQQTKFIKRK